MFYQIYSSFCFYGFLGDDLFYIDRADILVFGNYIKVFLCTNFEVLVIRELMNGH